jgi:chorismate synthase
VKKCPVGLGEPVFDRLEADLAKAMLSINASKGFEIGSGFQAAAMRGSDHNDNFRLNKNKEIEIADNHAGGILGGISSGAEIYFNVAFKPTSTIKSNSSFISKNNEEVILENLTGRHDPCIVPRAVAVVEAMTSLVLVDHLFRSKITKLS